MYLSTNDIIRAINQRLPRLRKMYCVGASPSPLQKSVLLRLRLAASEKPVLNAPAFACIAKPKEGGREHGTDGTAPRAAAGRI